MRKDYAIGLLGGSELAAANELGVHRATVRNWPTVLNREQSDRVLGARLRMEWREAMKSLDGHAAALRLSQDARHALGLER